MAVFSDCPSCIAGEHDRHVYHWGVRPEGVIDGDFCACTGDCAERRDAYIGEFFDFIKKPRTRTMDIRITWEEQNPEFDGYVDMKLVSIERVSTDIPADYVLGIQERWAQSDYYMDEVLPSVIDVFAGRTFEPDR